jgi:hypothetical protein
MIEITTSVVFLLSSMYGAGTDKVDTAVAINNNSTNNQNTQAVILTGDPKEVEKYIREKYADTPILIEIARCESTFRHEDKQGNVLRGKVDKADVGVMQINERYHLEKAKSLGFDLHTIQGNTAYAEYLYEKEGAKPWSASAKCWSKNDIVAKK